mgnify:CR=1 FL=1
MKKVQFVLQGCLKMGGNGKISLFFTEMRGMFTLFPVLSRLRAGALPSEIPATRDMGRKGCPDRVRFLLLRSRLVLSRVSNKRGIRLQGIHCNQTLYMRIRKYVVLILFSAICTFSSGQISFGPELGTFMFASRGLNVVDSVFVDTYNGKDVGELMGGVFFEADMPYNLSVLTSLSYRKTYISSLIYNPYDTTTAPFVVRKGNITSIRSFLLNVTPTYAIPLTKDLRLKVLAGIALSFNIVTNPASWGYDNERHPKVSAVIRQMNDGTVRPVSAAFTYGFGLEYWRFAFWAKWQHQSSYTRFMTLDGNRYTYRNTWRFLNLSLGYKLFNWAKE